MKNLSGWLMIAAAACLTAAWAGIFARMVVASYNQNPGPLAMGVVFLILSFIIKKGSRK
jgi:hypothetical protein